MQATAAQAKQIPDICIEACAKHFGIRVDELKTKTSRRHDEVYKRYICFYLIKRNHPPISYDGIAKHFGMSFSTVQHGIDSIEDQIKTVSYRWVIGDLRKIQALIDNFNDK